MNNFTTPITDDPLQPEPASDSRLPILIALTVAIPLFIVTVGLCIVGVRRACKRFQRRPLISEEAHTVTVLRVTQTVSQPTHYIPDTTFKHSTTPVDCAFPTLINMEDPTQPLREAVDDLIQKIEGLDLCSDIEIACQYSTSLNPKFNPVESTLQKNYNVLYNCYHVKLNKILRKIQQGHLYLPHRKTADHQDTPHAEHDYHNFYAYTDNPSDPGISDLVPEIPDSALLGRYRVERPSPDETPAHRISNPYTLTPAIPGFFDPPQECEPKEGSSSFSDHSSDTSLGF